MDLFNSEESRDELGLGAVRDALSDLMFPGTSTIQTRFRYMLFVPWIYGIAGAQTGTAAARQDYARALEIRLIEALLRGGEDTGVIGSAARERLKRLPSDVYWAGLLTLGIRRFQGSRNACLEASPSEAQALWAAGLPRPPNGFLMSDDYATSFALTVEEADFLRDRLVATAPDSLFTRLARLGGTTDCSMIWLHPDRGSWPDDLQRIVTHAERVSGLMHGASLLYNLMLSERAAAMQGTAASSWHERAVTYSRRLAAWRKDIPAMHLENWSLEDLWLLARRTVHNVNPRTCRFVQEWRAVVLRAGGHVGEDEEARHLIQAREQSLKGIKSRFRNDGALARWSGASGTEPLSFRWPVAASHLKDLADAG
ncbi:MAG: DUF6361 family protein [Rhodovulum sp.]